MNNSKFFYTSRFALYALLAVCVLYAVFFAMEEYFGGLVLGGAVGGMVIGGSIGALLGPAAIVARLFLKHEGRGASFGEGLTLSALFAFVLIAISFAVTAILNYVLHGAWSGYADLESLNAEVGSGLVVIFLVAFVILTLMIWLFFWSAIRGEMKKAAKKSKRG